LNLPLHTSPLGSNCVVVKYFHFLYLCHILCCCMVLNWLLLNCWLLLQNLWRWCCEKYRHKNNRCKETNVLMLWKQKRQTRCYEIKREMQKHKILNLYTNCVSKSQVRHKCKVWMQIVMANCGWGVCAKHKGNGEVQESGPWQ
jgi:hypothetical protein